MRVVILMVLSILLTGCSEDIYILSSTTNNLNINCPVNAVCEIPNYLNNTPAIINTTDYTNTPLIYRYE